MAEIIRDFEDQFRRYRDIAEKAMAQVPDDALNRVPTGDANSIAMLVRHISGNLRSRFTDFLTTDGEKPWRQRDDEFVERTYARDQMVAMWEDGWQVLDGQFARLTDADLSTTVTIRGEAMSVHMALVRALAHITNHVGQIILLSRLFAIDDWNTLSIPKRKP